MCIIILFTVPLNNSLVRSHHLFHNYKVCKYSQVAKKGTLKEKLFYPTYLHPVTYQSQDLPLVSPTYLHPVIYQSQDLPPESLNTMLHPHSHLSQEASRVMTILIIMTINWITLRMGTTPTPSPLSFPAFLQPSKEAALIVMDYDYPNPSIHPDNIKNGGNNGYSTFSFLAPGA